MFDTIRGPAPHPLRAPLWTLCLLGALHVGIEAARWYVAEARYHAAGEAIAKVNADTAAALDAMEQDRLREVEAYERLRGREGK